MRLRGECEEVVVADESDTSELRAVQLNSDADAIVMIGKSGCNVDREEARERK